MTMKWEKEGDLYTCEEGHSFVVVHEKKNMGVVDFNMEVQDVMVCPFCPKMLASYEGSVNCYIKLQKKEAQKEAEE